MVHIVCPGGSSVDIAQKSLPAAGGAAAYPAGCPEPGHGHLRLPAGPARAAHDGVRRAADARPGHCAPPPRLLRALGLAGGVLVGSEAALTPHRYSAMPILLGGGSWLLAWVDVGERRGGGVNLVLHLYSACTSGVARLGSGRLYLFGVRRNSWMHSMNVLIIFGSSTGVFSGFRRRLFSA